MLTKKEYNDIAEYVMKELMGNRPKVYTLEYWSKNGAINGNGILKHLRENYTIDMNEESENRYTAYRSEHGIAIVPNTSVEKKSFSEREFESELIERMNKGTHIAPLPEVVQYINNITETLINRIERDCYIPSEETDKERLERMNVHQRCCQEEADAARKEHNKNKDYDLEKKFYETMFSCADHRKTVEELEDNIKYLKERITGGEDSEKKFEQLCDLLEKSKTDLENGTKVHELKTGNMKAETINIKRIEDLEEIVSVLCCVVLEMGRPSYNNLQNDIGRLKYVLAKKGK